MIAFPDISPEIVTLSLGGYEFAIRWYAMAYLVGLLLGWWLVQHLMRRPALWGGEPPMRPDQVEGLLTWVILGVVLGGRLGYVLFYQPAHYVQNPMQIFVLWHGGMSFHGGFAGVIVAAWIWAGRQGVARLRLADALAVVAPIGLGLGRLANFVNAELWGRPTDVPWGVVFPGEVVARHPSQLYEAALEGVLLFALLLVLVARGGLRRPGLVFGVFLAGYGAARMFVEHFRQADAQFITPDNPLGHVIGGPVWGLSMGQVLSLPMLLVGLGFIVHALRRPRLGA